MTIHFLFWTGAKNWMADSCRVISWGFLHQYYLTAKTRSPAKPRLRHCRRARRPISRGTHLKWGPRSCLPNQSFMAFATRFSQHWGNVDHDHPIFLLSKPLRPDSNTSWYALFSFKVFFPKTVLEPQLNKSSRCSQRSEVAPCRTPSARSSKDTLT